MPESRLSVSSRKSSLSFQVVPILTVLCAVWCYVMRFRDVCCGFVPMIQGPKPTDEFLPFHFLTLLKSCPECSSKKTETCDSGKTISTALHRVVRISEYTESGTPADRESGGAAGFGRLGRRLCRGSACQMPAAFSREMPMSSRR